MFVTLMLHVCLSRCCKVHFCSAVKLSCATNECSGEILLCYQLSPLISVALFPTLTELVTLGRKFGSVCFFYLSVCLFVCCITQKRMIPKSWYREWSWDILEVTRFCGWNVKGHSHKVNKCIFHTNDYYAYVNAHLTDNSNMMWVWTLWVPSLVLSLSSIFSCWPHKMLLSIVM